MSLRLRCSKGLLLSSSGSRRCVAEPCISLPLPQREWFVVPSVKSKKNDISTCVWHCCNLPSHILLLFLASHRRSFVVPGHLSDHMVDSTSTFVSRASGSPPCQLPWHSRAGPLSSLSFPDSSFFTTHGFTTILSVSESFPHPSVHSCQSA